MSDFLNTLIVLIPALPLAASLVTAAFGPKLLRGWSHLPSLVGIVGAFLASLLLVWIVAGEQSLAESRDVGVGYEQTVALWTWIDLGGAYDGPTVGEAAAADDGPRNFLIDVTLRVDALTATMLATVTFIASLVVIYSIGYMHGDPGYWRFFSYLGLFVFSMTMLVSVSNFVLLYVFWEAVGVCSYLLIGFWYERPAAAAAGKKAFLVNRIGDFGFAIALFLLWITYGTLNFHDVLTADGALAMPGILGQARLSGMVPYALGGVSLAICLLLMLAACGKSAQFPLHVWLPDAMEGPTSVSALIHAATMVTAGVYLVTRCTPLFMLSPDAQLVVASIGGFTALLAGLIALTQFDLKRVLAYSTVSQLGYMFLALGTGSLAGITAGMFHLLTHAFFKALLFLGAGSVMHSMGNVIDMRRFSGLRRVMPITHLTFAAGCLALAGVVPFAGFWSKDAIVAAVHDKSHDLGGHAHEGGHGHEHGGAGHVHSHSRLERRTQPTAAQQAAASLGLPVARVNWHPGHDPIDPIDPLPAVEVRAAGYSSGIVEAYGGAIYNWLYLIALFTAFLTAFYTFRAFFMTFYGELTTPLAPGHHPHESPPVMWVPLAVLAVGATVVGGAFEYQHGFAHFLGHTPSLAYAPVVATVAPGGHVFHWDVAAISTIIALAGVGLAAFMYLGHRQEADQLAYILRFDWLKQLASTAWISRLRTLPAVAAVERLAARAGLSWLASLVGYVILLLLLVLMLPLLVGYYISPYQLSKNKFYFDELYDLAVVRPLRFAAAVFYWIDQHGIDALVNFCGWLPRALGGVMRSLQMGLVPFYALAMVLGMLVLVAARVLWAG